MNFKVRGKVNTKPLREAKYDADGEFESYDMFVFITNLFTRDSITAQLPINPLGRKHKHFEYTARDGESSYSPFAVDYDGNIVIGAENPADFDDVRLICDKYQFNYTESTRKTRVGSSAYYITIEVPTYPGTDTPMSVDDYFEEIGIPLEQVMPKWYFDNKAKFEKEMVGVGVHESMDNINKVVDDKDIDTTTALDATTARARQFRKQADEEVEKRMKEHEKATGVKRGEVFTGAKKQSLPKKIEEPKRETLSESLFEDVEPDEATIKADLQTALRKKGLKLNPKEGTIDDAVEYIMSSGGEITVDEWIKETQRNYPEYFDESLTEGRYGLPPKYTRAEAEDMRDQFIAMVEEDAIDAVEALKSFCYWLTADEVADFIDANGFLPEDDLRESKKLRESEEDEMNAAMEEYWDKYDVACRYFDIEIPDICEDALSYLNASDKLPNNALDYIIGRCRRFKDDIDYILK